MVVDVVLVRVVVVVVVDVRVVVVVLVLVLDDVLEDVVVVLVHVSHVTCPRNNRPKNNVDLYS